MGSAAHSCESLNGPYFVGLTVDRKSGERQIEGLKGRGSVLLIPPSWRWIKTFADSVMQAGSPGSFHRIRIVGEPSVHRPAMRTPFSDLERSALA